MGTSGVLDKATRIHDALVARHVEAHDRVVALRFTEVSSQKFHEELFKQSLVQRRLRAGGITKRLPSLNGSEDRGEHNKTTNDQSYGPAARRQ